MLAGILKPVYKTYEWLLEKEIKGCDLKPKHIAIIMDGNRRLAEKFSLPPWHGHRMGAEKLREVLRWCLELNIKEVTAYAFSTENFLRSREEVEKLFDLFEEYFNDAAKDEEIHRNRTRIKAIGRINLFPERVRRAIKNAEEATRDYDAIKLNVALAYGGRQEIVDAVKEIARKVKAGELSESAIDEAAISKNLYTNGSPDPDLIIRTSGEERISGFLLWQSAYSELYFCESFWPEFRKIDFLRAVRTFQRRERRYGK